MIVKFHVATLAIILAGNASGQLRNAADDYTGVLKAAKKVAVFIDVGTPALGTPTAGPYRPDFARAKKQITEKLSKQNLKLVVESSDADIVLVAREFNESDGAVASATSLGPTTTAVAQDLICLGDEVKVFKGGKAPSEADTPIWSTTEVCGFSWPLNRAMDKLAKLIKQ
jgi:hypothetical protein